MDRIKWNSDVYDGYIASLRKMNLYLDEEIQTLTAARKKLLQYDVTAEDKALDAVLSRLEKTLKQLSLLSDRIRRLQDALIQSADIFAETERRIGKMGMDLLYTSVMSSADGKGNAPLYIPYSSAFHPHEVVPEWLASLSEGSSGTLS